jgi:DNA-binding MarR family transcriptional regulator
VAHVRTSKLLAELKQTQPFRSPGVEAEASILRVADRLRGYYNRVLDPYGITFPQFNVLRILRGTGAAGLPTLEIAGRMIEEAPGITRMLGRLERKALVKRVRKEVDRRVVTCTISAKGLALLQRLDEPIFRADQKVTARLGRKELRALIQSLDKVRDALESERKLPIQGKR